MHEIILVFHDFREKLCNSIEETLKNFIIFVLVGFFLSACSPYDTQIKREYDTQHYTQTYKTLQKATKNKSNDWLLWKMQSGFLTFSYFGAHFSIDDLEQAEVQFKIYEEKGLLSSVGENVGATLSNDMAMPYHGMIFEGALLNFYKALAFSSLGDNVQARIEFNRANDRQRRAKEYYNKEIKKAHDETIKEANEEAKSTFYETNTKDSELNNILNTKYTNLGQFAVYKDMINPLIPYVSGLYFMIEKDLTKSIDLLKESYGISKAQLVARDMQLLESRKGKIEYPKFTWVIIEDGSLARKKELTISQPLVTGNGINAINLALPDFVNGKPTYSAYKINATDADLIGNVSNLFASEFEKQLPSIITRAIVGALVKFGITSAISAAGSEYGAIIGLASALAFRATTAADLRSSIVLSDSVWIARIPNTESSIKVYGNNDMLLEIPITKECNARVARIASKDQLDALIKAKPKDVSARIKFFKRYYENGNEDRLCVLTDNIIYLRVHRDTVAHTVIKGD